MAMPLVAPRYTIADLDRFPDDGNRYELLGGVLLVTPAPGPPHQYLLGRLTAALWGYLGTDGPAMVLSPGVIKVGNDTQLEPDLLVVPSKPRQPKSWRQLTQWWLAVEVSALASRVYDRDFKTSAYLRIGVREVWRVDLRDQAVHVSRGDLAAPIPHTQHLTWRPPELATPFELELTQLFGDGRGFSE